MLYSMLYIDIRSILYRMLYRMLYILEHSAANRHITSHFVFSNSISSPSLRMFFFLLGHTSNLSSMCTQHSISSPPPTFYSNHLQLPLPITVFFLRYSCLSFTHFIARIHSPSLSPSSLPSDYTIFYASLKAPFFLSDTNIFPSP